MSSPNRSKSADWPDLPFADWSQTAATLHMFTQVVGKIRLVRTPWTHHSWHVPLYVTARGLGTSPIPYDWRASEIDFDLLRHQLVIQVADGAQRSLPLEARPVCDFHDVRRATSPDDVLLEFLQSTYEAAAGATGWDRAALERELVPG